MNWEQIREWFGTNLLSVVLFVGITGMMLLTLIFLRRLLSDPLRHALRPAEDLPSEPSGFASALLEGMAAQSPAGTPDDALSMELRRAGFYQPTARRDYMALRNGLVLFTLIFTGALVVAIGPERQDLGLRVMIMGVILAVLGWAVPRVLLRSKGEARLQRIRQALPNALDMLTMCMTGGLSVSDSLQHVSRELYTAHPDLAIELLFVQRQAEMSSLPDALRQFALRVDADEIVSMSALVGQGQRLGTGMVSSIHDYADAIRHRWRYMADEQAGKAAVKLLLPIVFLLLPSVFIFLWGPSVLELWTFFQQFEGAGPINLEPLP